VLTVSKGTFARRDLLKGAAGMSLVAAAPIHARAPRPSHFPTVQKVMDGVIAEPAAPGAIAAIGLTGAPTTFVSAGTLALNNPHRVDQHTLFRIYSMTKPIIGMAVMLLIAEGRMKLDQPVADFLPAFANMRVLTDPSGGLDSRPASTVMTIRHLLTHTAGLGSSPVAPALETEYKRLGLTQNLRNRSQSSERAATAQGLAEFAERLASAPLLAEPGQVWSYSVSFDLLGRIIELAGGMPLEQFLARRFFDPLRMASTYFTVPPTQKARLVTSYTGRGAQFAPIDPGASSIFLDKPAFPSGGGGLISSAHDYDRFLAMLVNHGTLDGATILPPSAVATGTSNLLPPGVNMRRYAGIPGVVGFGAGGCIADYGGYKGMFGWLGAAGTIGVIVPGQQLRLTGLLNNFTVFSFALSLPNAVHSDLT